MQTNVVTLPAPVTIRHRLSGIPKHKRGLTPIDLTATVMEAKKKMANEICKRTLRALLAYEEVIDLTPAS